jgi:DNA-directed RNA polymerase subunit beta'
MGHIQLVFRLPISGSFKTLPNKIGALLGLTSKLIDSIIYYEKYVVIQAGWLNLKK